MEQFKQIMKAIEEKLQSQEEIISLRDWQIEGLKKQLKEAEKTIEAQSQLIESQAKELDLKGFDR